MIIGPYVLITPARNEGEHIEKTLQSVVEQTVVPAKWIIVSDGSTDRTDEIVQRYAANHSFIQCIRKQGDEARNFGSKVRAFKAGYDCVQHLPYEYVGNLDADVTLPPNYFEKILEKLHQDPHLGIAGGSIWESINNRYVEQKNSSQSVAGAIQLFRRNCYEQIGGYLQLPWGGIDAAAEIMARSFGWSVQSFDHIKVLHHRRVSSVGVHILKARYRQGVTHYLLGYRPLFQIAKCLYRTADKPYVLGSLLVLCGYLWTCVRRLRTPMPAHAVKYFRLEQKERMLSFFADLKIN